MDLLTNLLRIALEGAGSVLLTSLLFGAGLTVIFALAVRTWGYAAGPPAVDSGGAGPAAGTGATGAATRPGAVGATQRTGARDPSAASGGASGSTVAATGSDPTEDTGRPSPVLRAAARALAALLLLVVVGGITLGITLIVATGMGKAISFEKVVPTLVDKP